MSNWLGIKHFPDWDSSSFPGDGKDSAKTSETGWTSSTRGISLIFGIFEKRSFDVQGLRYFFLFVVLVGKLWTKEKVGEGGKTWGKAATRWFKVTFWSPSWRSLNPLKGSLNHPKKVTLNHQLVDFLIFDRSAIPLDQICRRNRSKLTGHQWSFWVDLVPPGKKKTDGAIVWVGEKSWSLFLLDKIPNYLRLVVLVYCTMVGLNGFDTSPGWYMNSVMNWWIANLNWCRIFWSNCAIAMNLPKFVIFVNPYWRQLVEVDFLRFIQRVLDFTEFTGLTFNTFKSCMVVYCPQNNEESNNLKIILKWKEKSFEPNQPFKFGVSKCSFSQVYGFSPWTLL